MSDEQLSILHAFADWGVEAEVLSSYGSVTRYTIDPEPNEFVDETITADLMETIPEGTYDLGLLHPSCKDKSQMTSINGSASDHENQIPRAREIAQQVCDHYIIENKPRDDLRNPTVLSGKQFGLPIAYERAFETSYEVRELPRHQNLPTEVSPYFSADRTADWWRSVKGYYGEYTKEHPLVKNCVPAPYIQFLIRNYFRAVNPRDGKPAQDNCGSPPPKITEDQRTLTEVGRGGE